MRDVPPALPEAPSTSGLIHALLHENIPLTAAGRACRTYLQALKGLNRDVCLFLVSVAVSGISYMGLYFLLINLYLLRLGYGLEFIGIFVSVGAFSFALFSLPAGMAGRRWGTRRCMLFGMALLALGLAMLALTALVPVAWRSAWLIFFCALREFGNSFYLVNANPYLMQATTPAERDYAFSIRATLTPLAGFFGTLAGGWLPAASATLSNRPLDDPINFMAPLLLSSLLLLPGLFALKASRDVAGTTTEEDARRGVMPVGLLLSIAAISLLFIVAAAAGQSFYHVYMDTVIMAPPQLIGTLASCGQLLSAFLMLTAPALMRRWGHARTFILTAVGMGLSLVPMAWVAHWTAAGFGIVGVMTLMAFASTALTVFHQGLVPTGWQPAMSGACLMAMGVGWGIVSSGGGYFIAAWGWTPFFLLAAGVTTAGALIFWWCFARGPARPD
jgi:predicted MFS family arabinose efflux permease